ncbi:Retrotransposon protein [Hordeum vulgare]|nr:Retrotransposon protein [Hordeum vulgare]
MGRDKEEQEGMKIEAAAGGKSGRKFKRRTREPSKEGQEHIGIVIGKRAGEEMETGSQQEQKKGRMVDATEGTKMNQNNQILLDIQKKEDPDMLFSSETKLDARRIEWWKWKLGMTGLVVKDCEGKGGGLAMF